MNWNHKHEQQQTARNLKCLNRHSTRVHLLFVLQSGHAVARVCLFPFRRRNMTSQQNLDLGWTGSPGAKFLFIFYFLRIQLSATFWLPQSLLSLKQMQFFT